MTIIKDLTILNDDNFYLTKEDKTIKNEYNVIGKSYNKKEKYKTQETNYEISLEYILKKSDKTYFFNLLNNNNYFLYKRKETFLSNLVYKSNITTLYIDINDPIFNNINISNYDINNRLYLLINNKKYSFYFDETYDYNIDNKYRLIDEISLNSSSNLNNVKAEILDICILLNNNIKFKFLTDEKYSLTFDIETINNIITSLSINNTITPNVISELSYNELYALGKNILYTKLLKLNSNHYLLINIYTLIKGGAHYTSDINNNLYIYIEYKKIYINNDNIIEKEESFYSLLDFNQKIRYYDLDTFLDRNYIFRFIDFNIILDNNEIFLNFTTSRLEYFNSNFKTFNDTLKTYEYKKSPYINNIITNTIEYLKFEIIDKKMNIVDYKKQELESLVDYKKIKYKNPAGNGWGGTNSDLYQHNVHSNMYIYNNLLYISNFVNYKIVTNQYNKSNNELKQININETNAINNNYNYICSYPSSGVNIGDNNYNYYYRAKEEDIDYKIKNKSIYYNFFKNQHYSFINYNNLIESKVFCDFSNLNLLFPKNIGISGDWNNKNTIQKVLSSNNKKIFINEGKNNQGYINNPLRYLFKNVLFFLNNQNELKKITTINFMNNINENFEVIRFLFISKDSIKFYYNTITNKYILLILSYDDINYPDASYLKLLEFEYDDNETINITNIKNISMNYSNNSTKNFDFYFDETNRKYYINLNYNTSNSNTTYDNKIIICLNEDLSINFNIKNTKEFTY